MHRLPFGPPASEFSFGTEATPRSGTTQARRTTLTLTLPALTLVTGGARAGKSRYALSLVARGGSASYIATAEALDDDMRERIARHRAERPASWTTVEAPLDLAGALRGVPPDETAIVDCLTLWVSNLLLRLPDVEHSGEAWYPGEEVERVIEACAARRAATIVVTNEVGLGVVPPTLVGRVYRDALGRVNQRVAEVAGSVCFLVCGIPLQVKPPGSTPS